MSSRINLFIVRSNSYIYLYLFFEFQPESVNESDVLDNELPDRMMEPNNSLTTLDLVPKLPLMDALNDAMQEITINSVLPASESTSALSSISCPLSDRSGVSTFSPHYLYLAVY